MPRHSTASEAEDAKLDVKPVLPMSKSKRKRGADSSDLAEEGTSSSSSPQPSKDTKPRIKQELKAGAKSSAWSKAQVRQLWDALDMKPVS